MLELLILIRYKVCPRAFQVVLVVKNLPANAGDIRDEFDPWVGKMPWRQHGNPFQYSCLENSMNRGAWLSIVYGVTKILAENSVG